MRLASYQPDIAPNLGSMIRLCACFGVSLDIIEPCGFPLSLKSYVEAHGLCKYHRHGAP